MPQREIKLALMTYTDEAGVAGRYGFKGEKVDVHKDFVGKFDELNVDMGPDHVPERAPVAAVSPDVTVYDADDPESEPDASDAEPAKKAAPRKAT